MIKNIDIELWQSHKKTSLPLDPGVNMLTGDTESGKSAVLKAVDWIINNNPGGEDLEGARSNWDKKKGVTKGSIATDSHTVTRIKSNSNNEYQLDGESFKAFGQGVPKEVQDALNIGPINIQRQEDKKAEGRHLFLLTASSGEIARYLNKIVDLDIIDKAHTNIEKVKRRTSTELSIHQDTLKDQQRELKEDFADLECRERDIDALAKLERESAALKRSLDSLTQLNNSIARENQAIVPLMKRIGAEEQVNRLLETARSISADAERLRTLNRLTREIEDNQRICDSLSGAGKAEKQIDGLLGLVREIEQLKRRRDSLRDYGGLIADAEADIKRYGQDIVNTTKQFNSLMPERCPLCGK